MAVKSDDLAEVFAEAFTKFGVGEDKYGPFDPETDTRDLVAEAVGELLDCINYTAMLVLILRSVEGCDGLCKYARELEKRFQVITGENEE